MFQFSEDIFVSSSNDYLLIFSEEKAFDDCSIHYSTFKRKEFCSISRRLIEFIFKWWICFNFKRKSLNNSFNWVFVSNSKMNLIYFQNRKHLEFLHFPAIFLKKTPHPQFPWKRKKIAAHFHWKSPRH